MLTRLHHRFRTPAALRPAIILAALLITLSGATLGTSGAATAHAASGPVPLVASECQYTKLVGYSASYASVPLNRDGISYVEVEMFAYNDSYTNRYCGPAYAEARIHTNSAGFAGYVNVDIEQDNGGGELENQVWYESVPGNSASLWIPSYSYYANDLCQVSYRSHFFVSGDNYSNAVGNYVCFQA